MVAFLAGLAVGFALGAAFTCCAVWAVWRK